MAYHLILLLVCCVGLATGEDCREYSWVPDSLKCTNEIPTNISNRTRTLYLYFTHTSVPSVTFNNDSGRLQGADYVIDLNIICRGNNETVIHVKSGGFAKFHELENLWLECDNIILDEDAFDGLTYLPYLTIYNEIPTTLPARTGSLYLIFTKRTSVPAMTFTNDSRPFRGADNVERLSITCRQTVQTELHVKSGGFAKFHKLETLKLECDNIKLDEYAFDGLSYLERLYIYNEVPVHLPPRTDDLSLTFTRNSVLSVTFSNDSGRLQGADNLTKLEISCESNIQTVLHVKSGGFAKFHKLKKLELRCNNIILGEGALDGLFNLTKLSIYNAVNLSNTELLYNLKRKTLPNIQSITLENIGKNIDDEFNLNDLKNRFRGTLQNVYLYNMNISNLVIDQYGSLQYIIRYSYINTFEMVLDKGRSTTIPRIDGLEASVIRTVRLTCQDIMRWRNYRYMSQKLYVPFTQASIWSIEDNCDVYYKALIMTKLTFRNGFRFSPGKVFNVAELSIINCRLRNASNPVITKNVSLTKLSLSSNQMEFIHPDTFLMTSTLMHLDLSNNNLQNMSMSQGGLFGRLFASLYILQTVNLARNNLLNIPAKMFINNTLLRSIDLSENKISNLTFLTEGLNQLTYINLKGSALFEIDSFILSRLDLLCLNRKEGSAPAIVLKENRFACSLCEHNDFILWIQNNTGCIKNDSSSRCHDENRKLTNIFTKRPVHCPAEITTEGDTHTAESDKRIVYIAIAASLIFLVVTVVTCIIKRKRPKAQFGLPVLGLPINDVNRPPCKYFVFLAYSSQDEEFVNDKVKPELIEGLKARIKDDIEPVCIGDLKFRYGFSISDEIITCIEQSKAVLILLTDHYCRSNYCVIEFQRAIQFHKPVIVMVKDKVDQSLMTPEMKIHYKTNVRIIWKWENGDYVLKGSWKDICDSLVNLDKGT